MWKEEITYDLMARDAGTDAGMTSVTPDVMEDRSSHLHDRRRRRFDRRTTPATSAVATITGHEDDRGIPHPSPKRNTRRACTKGHTVRGRTPYSGGARLNQLRLLREELIKFRPMKTIFETRRSPCCHCVWAGPKSICSWTP